MTTSIGNLNVLPWLSSSPPVVVPAKTVAVPMTMPMPMLMPTHRHLLRERARRRGAAAVSSAAAEGAPSSAGGGVEGPASATTMVQQHGPFGGRNSTGPSVGGNSTTMTAATAAAAKAATGATEASSDDADPATTTPERTDPSPFLRPLEDPFWVRLTESDGTDPTRVPETRRAHSSCVYAFEANGAGESDADDPMNTTLSSAQPSSGDDEKPTTAPREFMITSGGFTDDDWSTFPVWAYDLTNSALDMSSGTWWTDLTPPPPPDSVLDDCRRSTVRPDATSDTDDVWEYAMDCPPPPRVGHLTVVHKGNLYVFGGLLYDDRDGVFYEEEQPFVYRLGLEGKLGDGDGDGNRTDGAAAAAASGWQRIVPVVSVPPPPDAADGPSLPGAVSPHDGPNRGEVRGGHWKAEDKVVIHGGLRVADVNSAALGGQLRQVDTPLGDVWSYDLNADRWELMAPAGDEEDGVPKDRTAHAAAVSGDELVIYGGMEKTGESPWDGSTTWSVLSDVWIFDLRKKVWRQRPIRPDLARAYHSAVAWQAGHGGGGRGGGLILAAFGGYTTVQDPVSAEPVTFVFDDTLISGEPYGGTDMTAWLKASWPSEDAQSISNRLEHTAVLSEVSGEMFVWGGRFQNTRQIEGMWALNVAGSGSNVRYDLAEPDGLDDYEDSIAAMHVLLAALVFMSIAFTTMCGVFNRHHDEDDSENEENGETPRSGGRGRSGLRQNIIDTLPVKTYRSKDAASEDRRVGSGAGQGVAGSDHSSDADGSSGESAALEQVVEGSGEHGNADDAANESNAAEGGLANEDDCCPICLVEYYEGDAIRCLPCDHEFHKSCVDPWLGNNASCPACRHCLRQLTGPPPTGLLTHLSSSSLLSLTRSSLSWRGVFNRHPRGTETEVNNDGFAVDDLSSAYVSSLELEEEVADGNNRGGELEIAGRSQASSPSDIMPRRTVRRGLGRGRRRGIRMGGRLVPLNDPLQPDASAVMV